MNGPKYKMMVAGEGFALTLNVSGLRLKSLMLF